MDFRAPQFCNVLNGEKTFFGHFCVDFGFVDGEFCVHRRVHLTQMVKQVILNGSTQNVIITEKTIKRPEIYF